jgi:hypothetical protein
MLPALLEIRDPAALALDDDREAQRPEVVGLGSSVAIPESH